MTGSVNSIIKGGKELRVGYTTGSCATAAAAAAAEMFFSGEPVEQVSIALPNGESAVFAPDDIELLADRARCSVRKDAGDDPDVTDGLSIVAECSFAPDAAGIVLEGGAGVGRVTAEGLALPVGEAAINPVPRRMILEHLERVRAAHNYAGGLRVTLSVPGGAEAARRTFNPRLGIEGGISILGTTGRVEPMSERAFLESIHMDIDRHQRRDPENILIAPGNYGRTFCRERLGMDLEHGVKYANFLGECLDYIAYRGFRRVLLVGHVGKLVKVAGGVMNTHSRVADCRMEILTAHAACHGADAALCRALMGCVSTDAALALLDGQNLSRAVFADVLDKIVFHVGQRLARNSADGAGNMEIGVLAFSGERELMKTGNVAALAARCSGGME